MPWIPLFPSWSPTTAQRSLKVVFSITWRTVGFNMRKVGYRIFHRGFVFSESHRVRALLSSSHGSSLQFVSFSLYLDFSLAS